LDAPVKTAPKAEVAWKISDQPVPYPEALAAMEARHTPAQMAPVLELLTASKNAQTADTLAAQIELRAAVAAVSS
jgi:hypothetical protein